MFQELRRPIRDAIAGNRIGVRHPRGDVSREHGRVARVHVQGRSARVAEGA